MNPFHYGNPVKSDQFLGRKKELRRINQRIITNQATAIIGEPRTGKTSLLLYIQAPENHASLDCEPNQRQRFFSYLDSLSFNDQINQAQFWTLAFHSLYTTVIENTPESGLSKPYQKCLANNFASQPLAQLLDQMERENYHLVLLVDEFDTLLKLPQLCSAEFFGSLRSLASLKPALSLVIASRLSLSTLNSLTQDLNPTGSPYFNIFHERTLGPFSSKDVELLFSRANGRFSNYDIKCLLYFASTHPYLLQAAAASLWDIYEDNEHDDPKKRLQKAAQELYDIAAQTFANTWRIWSPATRIAITIIALAKNSRLLQERLFHNAVLLKDLKDFRLELIQLKTQGYIEESLDNPSGWQIRPVIFQYWLSDELVRTVRNEVDFAKWIQAQEWDGLLTKSEKEMLAKAGKGLTDSLKDGISGLIKDAIGSLLPGSKQ